MTDDDWAAERRDRAAQRAESEERYRKREERWREERWREDAKAEKIAWLEILSRPADWVLPDEHNTYSAGWWVHDDAPCNERVCVPGRCVGSIHRVIGCWSRNEERTFWTFYPHQLPSEDHDQRSARLMKIYHKTANVVGRAVRLDLWMIDDTKDREPDVEVFCGARTTRGVCNENIAHIWHTARGYWVAGQYAPSKEAISTHIANGMQYLDIGGSTGKEMAAHEAVWAAMLDSPDRPALLSADFSLNQPKPGDPFPTWVVLGCPRHFNAAIDYPTMRAWVKEARRTRRSVMYDCSARMLGTMRGTASG